MHPLSFWDGVSCSPGWPPIPYVARVTNVCPCLFAIEFCVSVFSALVIKPNGSFTRVINSTTAPALAGTLRAAKWIAPQRLEQHISPFIPCDTCPRSFLPCICFIIHGINFGLDLSHFLIKVYTYLVMLKGLLILKENTTNSAAQSSSELWPSFWCNRHVLLGELSPVSLVSGNYK